jgi:hypothetical protein
MQRFEDTTPLAELRKNFLAALAVFVVVGLGAFAYVALINAF